MSGRETASRILAALTPERLRALILELAAEQPADQRTSVNLSVIMDKLAEQHDLGSGSEAWNAQLELKRGLVEMLSKIPEFEFVEGDA